MGYSRSNASSQTQPCARASHAVLSWFARCKWTPRPQDPANELYDPSVLWLGFASVAAENESWRAFRADLVLDERRFLVKHHRQSARNVTRKAGLACTRPIPGKRSGVRRRGWGWDLEGFPLWSSDPGVCPERAVEAAGVARADGSRGR